MSNLTPHENIYTIPNFLTFSRLLAAPVVGYLVLHDQHVWAVGLFVYAAVTDLVDGWIARRWKLQTVVGSVVDPMADKALMIILVGCLAVKGALPREFPSITQYSFPLLWIVPLTHYYKWLVWLATIILGRDVSLGIAAIYYRYASLPTPKTLVRYWDFSIPSAEVHPTTVSKYNTFLQLILIGSTLVLPVITDNMLPGTWSSDGVHYGVRGLQYVVAGTTLWSGASYVWRKDVVHILGTDEALKKKQGHRARMIIGLSYAAFVALALSLWKGEKNQSEDE